MLQTEAVSQVERPENLRRKIEQMRKEAIGGISVVKLIPGAHTPVLGDAGQLHQFDSVTDQAWALPSNFPQGWWIDVLQLAAGRPTFTGANTLAATPRIIGQWGRVRLEVVSNSNGSSAVWAVSGDVG